MKKEYTSPRMQNMLQNTDVICTSEPVPVQHSLNHVESAMQFTATGSEIFN